MSVLHTLRLLGAARILPVDARRPTQVGGADARHGQDDEREAHLHRVDDVTERMQPRAASLDPIRAHAIYPIRAHAIGHGCPPALGLASIIIRLLVRHGLPVLAAPVPVWAQSRPPVAVPAPALAPATASGTDTGTGTGTRHRYQWSVGAGIVYRIQGPRTVNGLMCCCKLQ